MKKLSTIIMALALVLGMSQCKKQETPTTGNTTPIYPGVDITVKVGDNEGKAENGEKHHIAPNYGLFAFSDGDKLYVGHDGKFVGTLTFSNGFFSGTIYPDATVTNQPLHFYFVGNAVVTETPTENETTSLSINIADQSTNLPVLSYGASTKPFTGEGTTYSTTLRNKCALVRFDLQNTGDYEVTLSNVPTLATVNFDNPTDETAIVATEGQTNANMTLYGEEGNTAIRWAILLPGTNLSPSVHTDLTWNGEGQLPVMGNNTYINSGLSINNPLPLPAAPDAQYAVKNSDGELIQFSVSANKKVYFSIGNLRHGDSQSSIPGWSLHAHQFDEHEDAYRRHGYSGTVMTGTGYNATYDMDRICWGRLANDSGHTYTAGSMWIYADNLDLTRTNGTDWGTVLTTEGNNWRMLTADEWNYLFNATARGTRRFIKVNVRAAAGVGTAYGVHEGGNFGVLLLPDNYAGTGLSTPLSSFNNGNSKKFVTIDLTSDGTDDVSKMLNAGAVFLPALGYRNADQYEVEQYKEYTYYNPMKPTSTSIYQSFGYYWSSTRVENGGAQEEDRMAKVLTFNAEINAYSEMLRGRGACVRLVWDAN